MAGPSTSAPIDVSSRLIKPPRRHLVLAGAFALVAVVCHGPAARTANIVGYVVGTVLTIAAVALFRREDARRSSSPWYTPDRRYDLASIVILVVGLAAAIAHIWYLSETAPA